MRQQSNKIEVFSNQFMHACQSHKYFHLRFSPHMNPASCCCSTAAEGKLSHCSPLPHLSPSNLLICLPRRRASTLTMYQLVGRFGSLPLGEFVAIFLDVEMFNMPNCRSCCGITCFMFGLSCGIRRSISPNLHH